MATASLNNFLFAPARVAINPTAISTGSFPFGGTEIGTCIDIQAMPQRKVIKLRHEYTGPNETYDGLDMGEDWKIIIKVRGFDGDAINTCFAAPVTGTTSNTKGIWYPGSTPWYPKLLSSSAVALLLAPEDTTNHHCTLLYKALPMTEETKALAYQRTEEFVLPLVFWAMRDSTNRIMAALPREDFVGGVFP